MIDRYTKGVLTVIAATLIYIAAKDQPTPALAQLPACGGAFPCQVQLVGPSSVSISDRINVTLIGADVQ